MTCDWQASDCAAYWLEMADGDRDGAPHRAFLEAELQRLHHAGLDYEQQADLMCMAWRSHDAGKARDPWRYFLGASRRSLAARGATPPRELPEKKPWFRRPPPTRRKPDPQLSLAWGTRR